MISWVPSLYTKSFCCCMGLETPQAAGLSSGTRNLMDIRTLPVLFANADEILA